jgi:hypothetical protein
MLGFGIDLGLIGLVGRLVVEPVVVVGVVGGACVAHPLHEQKTDQGEQDDEHQQPGRHRRE